MTTPTPTPTPTRIITGLVPAWDRWGQRKKAEVLVPFKGYGHLATPVARKPKVFYFFGDSPDFVRDCNTRGVPLREAGWSPLTGATIVYPNWGDEERLHAAFQLREFTNRHGYSNRVLVRGKDRPANPWDAAHETLKDADGEVIECRRLDLDERNSRRAWFGTWKRLETQSPVWEFHPRRWSAEDLAQVRVGFGKMTIWNKEELQQFFPDHPDIPDFPVEIDLAAREATFSNLRPDYLKYLLDQPWVGGDLRQKLHQWYALVGARVHFLRELKEELLGGPGTPTIPGKDISSTGTSFWATRDRTYTCHVRGKKAVKWTTTEVPLTATYDHIDVDQAIKVLVQRYGPVGQDWTYTKLGDRHLQITVYNKRQVPCEWEEAWVTQVRHTQKAGENINSGAQGWYVYPDPGPWGSSPVPQLLEKPAHQTVEVDSSLFVQGKPWEAFDDEDDDEENLDTNEDEFVSYGLAWQDEYDKLTRRRRLPYDLDLAAFQVNQSCRDWLEQVQFNPGRHAAIEEQRKFLAQQWEDKLAWEEAHASPDEDIVGFNAHVVGATRALEVLRKGIAEAKARHEQAQERAKLANDPDPLLRAKYRKLARIASALIEAQEHGWGREDWGRLQAKTERRLQQIGRWLQRRPKSRKLLKALWPEINIPNEWTRRAKPILPTKGPSVLEAIIDALRIVAKMPAANNSRPDFDEAWGPQPKPVEYTYGRKLVGM